MLSSQENEFSIPYIYHFQMYRRWKYSKSTEKHSYFSGNLFDFKSSKSFLFTNKAIPVACHGTIPSNFQKIIVLLFFHVSFFQQPMASEKEWEHNFTLCGLIRPLTA